MIQVTPLMRILVAVDPVDFRKGIDGLAGICKAVLQTDPFSGCSSCSATAGGPFSKYSCMVVRATGCVRRGCQKSDSWLYDPGGAPERR